MSCISKTPHNPFIQNCILFTNIKCFQERHQIIYQFNNFKTKGQAYRLQNFFTVRGKDAFTQQIR